MNDNYIITIGREYGSGGLEIGQKLAEKLGIKCYDKELIESSGSRKGTEKKKFLKKRMRKKKLLSSNHPDHFSPSKPSKSLPAFGAFGKTANDKVFLAESAVIHELANEESCIIIGRCADVLLKDRENVLTIFIQAPDEARIKRLAERLELSEDMARKEMRHIDKIRASYYQFYTDENWGGRRGYDLIINSAAFGIDKTVDFIEKIVKSRFY